MTSLIPLPLILAIKMVNIPEIVPRSVTPTGKRPFEPSHCGATLLIALPVIIGVQCAQSTKVWLNISSATHVDG